MNIQSELCEFCHENTAKYFTIDGTRLCVLCTGTTLLSGEIRSYHIYLLQSDGEEDYFVAEYREEVITNDKYDHMGLQELFVALRGLSVWHGVGMLSDEKWRVEIGDEVDTQTYYADTPEGAIRQALRAYDIENAKESV